MNTYEQIAQSEQHRAHLLREAEIRRLLRNSNQPNLTDRLLVSVGDWMITEGTRLKNRRRMPIVGSTFRMGNVEG